MATLPTATDYGRQPGLNVNRLDRPSPAGAELADSYQRAVAAFAGAVSENKEKENALNYALARNEAQQLDLEVRNGLAEDIDWATHDERYSEGFKTGLEKIGQKYKLSARDMAMWGSETDLIGANGRIQIGGRARILEVKEARGRYIKSKAITRELIVNADPRARNGLVLGHLDAIKEQVELGLMDKDTAALEAEEITQDFAMASVDSMDAAEQIRVLTKSLAYRRGYGTTLGEHAESFLSAAEDTGVPVELLYAVATRESDLDPSAVNKKSGAAGLMQLMEGTAGDLGVTNRMDAEQSIKGGAQYLAEQLERFDDPAAALAAYNWGPEKVQAAMDEYGDDWLSHAPQETREYVAALTADWDAAVDRGIIVDNNGKYDTGSGPLTPDDIRNGLGTESIVDFLHGDTAAKMLEAARKEDKANRQREESQGVVNRAWKLFPEDEAKRNKYIRDTSSGTVQNLAEEDSRQRNQDEIHAKEAVSTELYEDYGNEMENEGLRWKDIPSDDREKMLSRHQIALKLRSKALAYEEFWPAVTQRFRPEDGGGMSQQEWDEMPNYGRGGKTDQNLDTALFYNGFTEKDYNALVAEQAALRKLEGAKILTGDQTPKLMVDRALNFMNFKVTGIGGVAIEDKDKALLKGVKARLETRLRQRILEEQAKTVPPTELDEDAKNKILAELLAPIAFTDTDTLWFDSDFDPEEATRVHLMTTEQLEVAFIDLDDANQLEMEYKGIPMNVEDILRKKGVDAGIMNPSEQNLRRAAFAFLNKIGTDKDSREAEVIRRLDGN